MFHNHSRLEYIDSLRCFAALLVMVQHSVEPILKTSLSDLCAALSYAFRLYCNLGHMGVVLFFLVSGFVVPFSFKGSTPLVSFIRARVFRLYPAYWVSLCIAIVIFAVVDGRVFDVPVILANITMMQKLFNQPLVSGVYWTLFIELQFYILCAIAFRLNRLYSPHFLSGVIIGLLVVGVLGCAAFEDGHYTLFPARKMALLAIMFLGALVRLAYIEKNTSAQKWLPVCMGAVLILYPATVFFDRHLPNGTNWIADSSATWLGLLLFMLCVTRRNITHRVFAYIGTISYSFYLIHPIVLSLKNIVLSGFSENALLVLVPLFTFVASLLVAIPMYYFIERPCIGFGRKSSDV